MEDAGERVQHSALFVPDFERLLQEQDDEHAERVKDGPDENFHPGRPPPHRPTAIIASAWSSPDTGCSSPVMQAGRLARLLVRDTPRKPSRARDHVAASQVRDVHRSAPNRTAMRWIVQYAPSEPTT